MREPSPERTAYLAAERADYDARLAPLAECTATVLHELRGRTPAALRTVAWDHGPYTYYTVTLPGRELPELRRRTGEVEQTLLDLAEFGSPYAATGVVAPSPDDRLLAYSLDLTGAEAFTLRFRDLDVGTDLPVMMEPTAASGAWASDGIWFFTAVPDHLNRAHEVWRVQVHTGERCLVYAEADRRFARGRAHPKWSAHPDHRHLADHHPVLGDPGGRSHQCTDPDHRAGSGSPGSPRARC